MIISTKGRYALRFLIDIAENQRDSYVPLKDAAQRQQISEKYLEIIAKALVKGGCLTALRGKGGGYKLTTAPEQCGVKQIIELMEGALVPVACMEQGGQPCHRAEQCRTMGLWQGLGAVINEYLSLFTLADLMEQNSDNAAV